MGSCHSLEGHHPHLHNHHHHHRSTYTTSQQCRTEDLYDQHSATNAYPQTELSSHACAPFKYNEVILEYSDSPAAALKILPYNTAGVVDNLMQTCSKFGGQHDIFYSTEKSFSARDLPDSFQGAATLIKVLCGQTCFLKVSYISEERPDGYPHFSSRGKYICRVGSGFIHINNIDIQERMEIFSNHHPAYGPFRVQTAKHLIYDESEMKFTEISLYFDAEDISKVIKLNPIKIIGSDEDGDRVDLECITYDERLGLKLKEMEIERNKLWHKFITANKAQDDERKDEVIAVCISHIHGNPVKYISVGNCLEITDCKTADHGSSAAWRFFNYDASTCNGSSGGPVWICKQDGSFYSCVPHSYYKNSISYSALGALIQAHQS